MNELQVVVNTTPATLRWNFEELKLALATEMEHYKGLVYNDDNIKVAKADVAELRKLRKQVEDRRKEIKELCMEPYRVIEDQARELTKLIDDPIEMINGQVKEYEARQLQSRKDDILSYKAERFAELPDEVAEALMQKPNDPAWERVSTSRKAWQRGVDELLAQVKNDLEAVQALDADFTEEAVNTYAQTLSVPAVVRRVEDLRRQRDNFMARERLKQEAAAREAQAAAGKEPAPATPSMVEDMAKVQATPQEAEEITATMSKAAARTVGGKFPEAGAPGGGRVIRIFGTDEQIKKVLGYIRFIGARCVEVR